MDTRFKSQYKAVAEFKYSFIFFLFTGNFQLCQLCEGSWVHRSFKATWSGELSDKCIGTAVKERKDFIPGHGLSMWNHIQKL